ncbi:Hint domain-containing protein [Streptomyces sp. E5N91]|uniref:Hint domain-containing protein n=1 Tax=Streptomyces sp. E5N91 TaxID=1851996 RepID=UPI000EF5A32A|nr:Hint domain-containing protein [Streptomyces sp. E5N91]
MRALDEFELQRITAVMLEECLAADGTAVTHDPDDASHVLYLESVARVNGYTPDRHPALFRSFRSSRAEVGTMSNRSAEGPRSTDDFTDGQVIEYVGPLKSNGAASSQAIITRTAPVQSIFTALNIHNMDAGGNLRLLASGTARNFRQQTLLVQTDDTTAAQLPTTGENFATLTWAIAYEDGSCDKGSHSSASSWSANTSRDPVVLAPVMKPGRTVGDLDNIAIGLARGFNDPQVNRDIDYWFWQNQFENTTLLVPFRGSMHFNEEIAELGPLNPKIEFYLAREEGGMSTLTPQKAGQYRDCFQIAEDDPKRLDFSLMPTMNGPGMAIDFGRSQWQSNTQTFFTGLVTVVLKSGVSGWSTVLSSLKPEADETDGVAYIKPIVYAWHCLGGGTTITMSDRSGRNVEDLNSGMQVLGAGGSTQTVQATYAQPHYGGVCVIETDGGRSLTCSGTHPVMTPDGPVRAAALTVGVTVLTIDGTDVVSGVGHQSFNGEGLFNLELDGARGGTAFYANDILVGDHRMQVSLLRTPDPAWVRQRLGEEMRIDYDSHLQDIAAGRVR